MKSTIKITYINKNKLKRIKIINKLLLKTKIKFNKNCELDTNIKLIHLKNIKFNQNVFFNCCNNNTLIVFENCYFDCANIYLENGNYKIINPILSIKNKTSLEIVFCNNVEIIGKPTTNFNSIYISNTTNIRLELINNIHKLELYGTNIHLNNVRKIKKYYIRSEKINVKNTPLDYSNETTNKVLIGDLTKKKLLKNK